MGKQQQKKSLKKLKIFIKSENGILVIQSIDDKS